MTSVAVVAHSAKRLGGGLGELRDLLSAEGVTDPHLGRGAEEQVRARAGP